MNRALKVFAVVLIVALAGVALYRSAVPQSIVIAREINAYIAQPGSPIEITLREMEFNLATAQVIIL
jgi:hypothetical protein